MSIKEIQAMLKQLQEDQAADDARYQDFRSQTEAVQREIWRMKKAVVGIRRGLNSL